MYYLAKTEATTQANSLYLAQGCAGPIFLSPGKNYPVGIPHDLAHRPGRAGNPGRVTSAQQLGVQVRAVLQQDAWCPGSFSSKRGEGCCGSDLTQQLPFLTAVKVSAPCSATKGLRG